MIYDSCLHVHGTKGADCGFSESPPPPPPPANSSFYLHGLASRRLAYLTAVVLFHFATSSSSKPTAPKDRTTPAFTAVHHVSRLSLVRRMPMWIYKKIGFSYVMG